MDAGPRPDGLPSFAELMARTDAPPGSTWGLWGPDDELGTLNLLTDERTLRAVQHVRDGHVIALGLPLEEPRTGMSHRTRPVHRFLRVGYQASGDVDGGVDNPASGYVSRDDVVDGLYLQGSSQWDGFSHIRHPTYGNYNGVADEEIHGDVGARLGIDRWAARAIVGRGVLVDAARGMAALGRPFSPDSGYGITPDDLDEVLEWQGTRLETGDILLVRTGWVQAYLDADPEYQSRITTRETMVAAGLVVDEATIRWLWDHRVAAVAADNIGVEACPGPDPTDAFRLHRHLLPLLGMPLGEFWSLDPLAAACAEDGRYEMLLVSVPLNLRGAVGSPPQVVAIR